MCKSECVCMCVCACLSFCVCVCVWESVRVFINMCMCVIMTMSVCDACACVYVWECVCMCVHVCVCVCVCMCVCVLEDIDQRTQVMSTRKQYGVELGGWKGEYWYTEIFFFFVCIVATINRLIILPLFSACWVFSISCFHNPPNSDMDWGSLAYVHHQNACVYTWGLGTSTVSQHIFDLEKLFFFKYSLIGFETQVIKFSVWHPDCKWTLLYLKQIKPCWT